MTQDTTTTNRPDSTKKLRKKLAKREAKLMLRIENTKQKLQRGEQRLGRLQAKLEQRSGRLHDLEKKLEEVRTLSTAHTHTDEQRIESAQPGSQNGSSPTTQNDSKDEGHSKDTPSDVVQEVAEPDLTTDGEPIPPAEGRADVPTEPEATTSSDVPASDSTPAEPETTASSDEPASQPDAAAQDTASEQPEESGETNAAPSRARRRTTRSRPNSEPAG